MILILTLLAAFPLGYLMKTRTTAYLVFGLAFAHLFSFQTAQLVLEATRGSQDAFGDVNDAHWDWFGDTIAHSESLRNLVRFTPTKTAPDPA